MHTNKTGHWVVNGKDFCTTSYEPELPHPDDNTKQVELFCSCTEEEYLLMSCALKTRYENDSTNKQVFSTCWYPTPCPEGERSIQLITRTYVCLALMMRAIHSTCDSRNNQDVQTNIDLNGRRFTIRFTKAAETYCVVCDLIRKRMWERNSIQMQMDANAEWLVDLDSLEASIADTPTKDIYKCESKCKHEDGYIHPNAEYIYQECQNMLHSFTITPLVWSFKSGHWKIINYTTGEDHT